MPSHTTMRPTLQTGEVVPVWARFVALLSLELVGVPHYKKGSGAVGISGE